MSHIITPAKSSFFNKTRKHLESSYKFVAPKFICSVPQLAWDMMQPDEIEKYIKETIKIPDEIDVSFLLLEREATAMEIGITVTIVLIFLLILVGSIWACVARNALETRYPKVCNCQCPYCPRKQLHDMEAEVEYAVKGTSMATGVDMLQRGDTMTSQNERRRILAGE